MVDRTLKSMYAVLVNKSEEHNASVVTSVNVACQFVNAHML